MIYHSKHSDDFLWHLILRGKQKEKTKRHPNTKYLKFLVHKIIYIFSILRLFIKTIVVFYA